MTSSVARAAAHATALPPYVPPCDPGLALAIRAAGAAIAESGKPLARPLAVVTMSGTRPSLYWWAQNFPVRPNPVWISSNTSRIPCRSARSRRPVRNPAGAGTYPPSPSTGSMNIAAVSSGALTVASTRSRPRRACSTASSSLSPSRKASGNGATATPGITGPIAARKRCPAVVIAAAPMVRPWNEPSKTITFCRPVACRASRSAASTASLPELM